jgi:hypothetical protein
VAFQELSIVAAGITSGRISLCSPAFPLLVGLCSLGESDRIGLPRPPSQVVTTAGQLLWLQAASGTLREGEGNALNLGLLNASVMPEIHPCGHSGTQHSA